MTKYILILLALLSLACSQTSENFAQISSSDLLADKTIIDLTHSFDEETVYWVTAKEFALDTVAFGQTPKGYFYSANNFEAAEHGGTHIDAPIHFAQNTQSVDEIPLEKLIGPAIKVDVSERALKDRDYQISVDDFLQWEESVGHQIPDGAIILIETSYSRFYSDKEKYLGTDERGEEAVSLLHFPGLSPEAAEWLIKNRSVNAIGLDTPSIDYGQSELFESHVLLLKENIPAFENLTNLDQLPADGFTCIALPMKIRGGSGGPLRIIALLDN